VAHTHYRDSTETHPRHTEEEEKELAMDKAILTYQRQSITGEIRKRRLVDQAISTFVL
jgi:hypothetical protein